MTESPIGARLKNPLTGAPAATVDARAEFARIAASQEINPKARADFLATKRERVAASNTVLETANGGFQVLFLNQNYD